MKPWGKHTLAAAFFVSGLATGLALSSNALKPLIVDNVLSGAVIASKWLESSYLRNDTAPSAGQGSLNLTPEPAYNKSAIFAWGLGGAFFLIWIIRRRKRMAIKDVERTNALGVDGARMDSLTAQMPSAAPIEVPRSLIQNPFSNEIEGFDFETRVQWAISGSLRHGRVLGVIHFGFSTGGADVGPASLKLLNIRMIAIQKELKARLRSGDCVKITGEGKISVIIPLLALRPDLERIADRLYVVALKAGAELELPLAYAPGCAMYPIDGYSFAELSQAAEDRASFAVVPDVQRFSVPETANAGEQFLSSALVCERVCASPTNPRLAVIQYPRALEDEPARRLIVADALPEPVPPTGIVQQQSFSASLPSVTEPSCSAKPFIWRRFFRDAPQRVRRFICASKTRLSTTRLP